MAQKASVDALSRISTLEKEGCTSGEIDLDLKAKILHENHDSILGGHRSMNKIYEAIKRLSVAQYERRGRGVCKKCTKCQLNKTETKRESHNGIHDHGRAPF
jgi:hypothetical protein